MFAARSQCLKIASPNPGRYSTPPRDPRLNPYGTPRIPVDVDSRERELLTGMGNCYEACGEGFERTVQMVADTRHRTPQDVKQTLAGMAQQYGRDADYRELRGRLPPSFPF